MYIDDNLIERFKNTIKTKEGKEFINKKLSKNADIEIYKIAIYLGYLDASRTFSGQSKIKKDDKAINDLAKKIQSYIETDKEFSHDEYCNILEDNYKDISFGQAQKIVNMAFKYLYCIAEKDLKEKFDVCHMPIDGVMQEWIYRTIKKDSSNEYNSIIKKGKMGAWSKIINLKNHDESDGQYTYGYYQKLIGSICNGNKTQLQLDFEHWLDMSQTIAAENYIKSFKKEERKIDLIKCKLESVFSEMQDRQKE